MRWKGKQINLLTGIPLFLFVLDMVMVSLLVISLQKGNSPWFKLSTVLN